MDPQTFFLGAIAVATVLMAAIQVGVIIFGARLAQRVNKLVDRVETQIEPTIGRVNALSADVSRATAAARTQVERAEATVGRMVDGIEQAATTLHDAVVEPTRQGRAVWEGIRAALSVFRESAARATDEAEAESEAAGARDPGPEHEATENGARTASTGGR